MSQWLRQGWTTSIQRSHRRMVRYVFGGILGAILLIVISVVVLAFRVPTPPTVRIDALSLQRLDDEFRQAAVIAAQSGKSSEIRADETQVNSKIQQLIGKYQGDQNAGDSALR